MSALSKKLGILVFLAASFTNAAAQAGPAVVLSPTMLTFPSQLATTTSAPQTATLTNVGDQPLTISSVVLDGTFSQTNTCPTTGSLSAGASCIFTITFVAPNGGPSVQPGFIEITDNATPNLQVISLSGTVADFSLSASPTTGTVSAGTSANYAITAIASGGFNQGVSFTCGALPTGAKCSFSPSSITPGTNPASTTLTVSTTAASVLGVRPVGNFRDGPIRWFLVLLCGGACLPGLKARRSHPRLLVSSGVIALLLAVAFASGSCGGGGGGAGGGGSVATPPGTYTVLITGTPTGGPSSLSNPVIVTLKVK